MRSYYFTRSCDHVVEGTYEGGLKSFRPNKDTRHFSEIFFIVQHSIFVTLRTSPSDVPVSITRPNSTRRFSPQNNSSRM